jgi:hypothetical protein
MVNWLSEYPWVVVRVGCHFCPRQGHYRLVRLAAKFGPEIALPDLLDRLALDCPWRTLPWERPPGKYEAKCGAHFVDLTRFPPPPSDIPPAMRQLRLIVGGKAEEPPKSTRVGQSGPKV